MKVPAADISYGGVSVALIAATFTAVDVNNGADNDAGWSADG